ncbi:MAG TPA: RHS repeat-associated core domain-containing protein, partial [Vicinamibacterales bacterium]|nr:RHS repeat-associated core domain-containing protein [Vicinamibacterales bacterium]
MKATAERIHATRDRIVLAGIESPLAVTLAMPSDEHGGSNVALASSNTIVSVPTSVKVNPNATTATFSIAATPVSEPIPVVLTASYGGVIQRVRVIVAPENAVTLASLSIVPDRVMGGTAASGTVTLNRPAPFGGVHVTVEARRRNIVSVPNTFVVPEGASTASFTIATGVLHAAREKSVEIVAAYNNVSASATLTVLPSGQAAKTRAPVALCASLSAIPCVTQSAVRTIAPLGGRDGDPPPPSGATLFETKSTLYSPELTLLSETAPSSATTAGIAWDYVWFGGQPLAQLENATGNIRWYFNDHLGTPLIQTDATGRPVWQAEYEPYGTIYAIRRGRDETSHQPLRLPGQTAEDGSDLYQNVFRWYRAGWGRYTSADPLLLDTRRENVYGYALGNPLRFTDRFGLSATLICRPVYGAGESSLGKAIINLYQPLHCRIRVKCNCPEQFDETVGRELVNGNYPVTVEDFSFASYGSPWFGTPIQT